MTLLVSAGLLAGVFAVAPSCATPTAIDVAVFSEVPCATHAEVSLTLAGTSTGLTTAVPAAVATECTDLGDGTVRRGSVVITPQGDMTKLVAFALATRVDGQGTESCARDGKGCIVARRELHYLAHETSEVRVDLRLSCLGVVCGDGSTCVKGACVSDALPANCVAPCAEQTLSPADAGPPDASVGDASSDGAIALDASPQADAGSAVTFVEAQTWTNALASTLVVMQFALSTTPKAGGVVLAGVLAPTGSTINPPAGFNPTVTAHGPTTDGYLFVHPTTPIEGPYAFTCAGPNGNVRIGLAYYDHVKSAALANPTVTKGVTLLAPTFPPTPGSLYVASFGTLSAATWSDPVGPTLRNPAPLALYELPGNTPTVSITTTGLAEIYAAAALLSP